jgi:hypothetical protein
VGSIIYYKDWRLSAKSGINVSYEELHMKQASGTITTVYSVGKKMVELPSSGFAYITFSSTVPNC